MLVKVGMMEGCEWPVISACVKLMRTFRVRGLQE